MTDMKENILRVGTTRMQQVGIRSVSIEDLCKELGISKKTFYVYFPSKDDLVDAMLHAHETKITQDVQHLVANKSVVQLLADWAKIARQTEKSSHQTPPVLYDLKKYYPIQFQQHIQRINRVMQQELVRFLQKGQAEGIFRQEIDVEVAAMLMVNTHQIVAEYIYNNKLHTQEARHIGKTSMDIFLRGIFTPEGLLTLEKAIKK